MSTRLPESFRKVVGPLPEHGTLDAGDAHPFETMQPTSEGYVERGERVAHACDHELPPRDEARQEFLSQLLVRHARGPKLRLHAHESRRDVVLVEASRLRPLRREAGRSRIHLLLSLE